MPKAVSRLEVLQVCKLLQCVRAKDKHQIEKLTTSGIPHLVNYNDPDEGHTALAVAALANDDDMIEFLLGLGAHPDVMDFKGRTASMRAAEFGNFTCLEKLLNAGASTSLVDLDGQGIIFYCIAPTLRHQKCLELALSKNANVNNVSRDGISGLMKACETAADNEEICLMLLEKGADPNAKQESQLKPQSGSQRTMVRSKELKIGRTSLMGAAGSGSAKVVAAILEKGGNVNAVDFRKNHAAHFAAQGGHLEVLKCLGGSGANFDQVNAEGNTPIHLAAKEGHAMCCKYLSQRGCNPKPKNNEGNTARIIAKENGHKEAMKELRKAERTFGKVGKNNEPWAIQLYDWLISHQGKLIELLKKNFDLDETGVVNREEFCETLNGMQAPVEEAELVKLVILYDKSKDGKVDYNDFLAAKKWINKNYLMSAFEGKKKKKKGKGGKKKGKFKLVMPICIQEEGPRTPGGGPPSLYIPHQVHFTDVGRFDRDHPPKHPIQDDSAWYLQYPDRTYININDSAKIGDFDSLKMALLRGTPVDTRDKFYKTPLMVAASGGHLDMVKFLVESGAMVNARDNFKWTPLHHACHSGQLDVVQYLVEHGGEIDASTMNGGTPLTRAIESSRDSVVKYLIEHGARIQTENRKGMTPMDIAQAWADPRVVEIVQRKWDTLPPPTDKKKGGKGGKKPGGGKAKRPSSAPGDKKDDAQGVSTSSEYSMMSRHRKGSILRAASALAGGMDERENITYTPLKAWTNPPNTQELIHKKVVKRERFGWEVDFTDFQMPFKKNISERLEELMKEE